MSKLIARTLSDGVNDVAVDTVFNGSAKAWANLNGTGAIFLRDDFNIASVTDNGTGDYTKTFTSAFANSNFACAGIVRFDAGSGVSGIFVTQRRGAVATPSSFQLNCESRPASFFDCDKVMTVFNGDLA